mmetsp:Transcript_41662/g.163597  ORF Transcript_41662/g.163597 Transcript_41662/m.163597 type:complete len:102 (+) Transcript_41662:912-1217(+)
MTIRKRLSDLNDPTIFPAGETARESGITTACSLPVKSEICNPPILAVVMFYSREAMPFDSAKLSLAEEVFKSAVSCYETRHMFAQSNMAEQTQPQEDNTNP